MTCWNASPVSPSVGLAQHAPGFAHHVSIEGQLELMDGAGIDCMVMSLGNTPPYYTSVDVAADAARGANDLYVDLHTRHPRRFAVFIRVCHCRTLTPRWQELERGLDLPGVVGIGLGCSVLGQPLDDPVFDPLFAELNRRQTVVFVHPVGAGGGPKQP